MAQSTFVLIFFCTSLLSKEWVIGELDLLKNKIKVDFPVSWTAGYQSIVKRVKNKIKNIQK